MKKKVLSFALAAVLSAGLLTACGSDASTTAAQTDAAAPESTAAAVTEEAGSESTAAQEAESTAETTVESKGKVTVAATSVPHAEILEAAKPLMAAKGLSLIHICMQDVLGVGCSMVIAGFPGNGRTTVDGIHYVYGTRLEDSQFRTDPIHPMDCSFLPDIMHRQTDRPIGQDVYKRQFLPFTRKMTVPNISAVRRPCLW